MDVYIYQAALYCSDCAKQICRDIQDEIPYQVPDCICGAPFRDHKVDYDHGATLGKLFADTGKHYCYGYTADEALYDSDDYPKGPYGDGGGEADSPQHCDGCQKFLENDLTSEGLTYVTECVNKSFNDKNYHGNREVVNEWKEFYDIPNPNDLDTNEWDD